MFGSTILETAIGMVFVYLVFSLIASAIAEYISTIFDRRSDHLKHILFNLFDNDDPQGRTMLRLFIAHPMIQALNSTNWKPQFQSAAERAKQKIEQFELARNKWNAAATAVAAADQARDAAAHARDAAANATSAVTKIRDTQKLPAMTGAPASPDLVTAVAAAANAAVAADASASAAREAGAKATAAAALLDTVKKWREPSAGFAVPPPASVGPPPARPASRLDTAMAPQAAAPPAEPVFSASELATRASSVIDEATKAAQAATAAASEAMRAAKAADNAKRGLDNALIDLADVPRYIPDRTFIDVLLHVLTDDKTVRALARVSVGEGTTSSTASRGTSALWDRFASALAILQGVATRLPAGDSKNNVDRAIQSVSQTIAEIKRGAVEAAAAVGLLEKGTNELLAAVAAVPDDSLRTALEREIHASLRPLHAIGQNLLTLERAGQTIAMMAESSIKTALTAFLTQAGEDLGTFRQNVGSWFNDVMDHASGWYKRNTQRILVVIALFLCTINNVDTVSLVGHLSSSSEMRNAALKEARAMLDASASTEGTVQQVDGENARAGAPATGAGGQMKQQAEPRVAGAFANNRSETKGSASRELADQYKKALGATRLPLWWSQDELGNLWSAVAQHKAAASPDTTYSINYGWILTKLIGLLISILAVSMGAPFWFDVLNRLVNIRLTGARPAPTSDATIAVPKAPAPTVQ